MLENHQEDLGENLTEAGGSPKNVHTVTLLPPESLPQNATEVGVDMFSPKMDRDRKAVRGECWRWFFFLVSDLHLQKRFVSIKHSGFTISMWSPVVAIAP